MYSGKTQNVRLWKKDQLEKKTSCNRSIMTYSIETRTLCILKLKSLHADGLNQELNGV